MAFQFNLLKTFCLNKRRINEMKLKKMEKSELFKNAKWSNEKNENEEKIPLRLNKPFTESLAK